MADMVGELAQQRGARPEGGERPRGDIEELVTQRRRSLDAEHRHEGRPSEGAVASDRLAEDRGAPGDVEEVVGDLERETEVAGVRQQCLEAVARTRPRPRRRAPRRARTGRRSSASAPARVARGRRVPGNSRSSAWPRHIASTTPASRLAKAARWAGATRAAARAPGRRACALASRAKAARTATASPHCRCSAGLPRRSSASSMHGRSSRTSEAAWTSSTVQAASSVVGGRAAERLDHQQGQRGPQPLARGDVAARCMAAFTGSPSSGAPTSTARRASTRDRKPGQGFRQRLAGASEAGESFSLRVVDVEHRDELGDLQNVVDLGRQVERASSCRRAGPRS